MPPLTSLVRLCFAMLLACGAAGYADQPDQDRALQHAVIELGDASYPVREKAAQTLWAAGRTARPLLEVAARGPDLEIAARAREILADFRLGLYPDTPPAIVEQVRAYRRGRRDEKAAAVAALQRMGEPAIPFLARLAWVETDPATRAAVFQDVAQRASKLAAGLMLQGNFDAAEPALLLAAADPSDGGDRAYAAFLLVRGKLDATVTAMENRAREGDWIDPGLLAILRRAQGDVTGAVKAAQRAGNPRLLEDLLYEQADWNALALLHPPKSANPQDIEQLGFAAAYQRLSGHRAECDKLLTQLLKLTENNNDNTLQVAHELLLNEDVARAIDLLKKKDRRSVAFDLLAAQQRYEEAIDLARHSIAAGQEVETMRLSLAGVYHLLGLHDEADKVLATDIAPPAPGNPDPGVPPQVIVLEHESGLEDRAFEHAARSLAAADQNAASIILDALYPLRSAEAQTWWTFLRAHADARTGVKQSLARLRQIMDHDLPGKELDDLARAAADALPPDNSAGALRALAATLVEAGRLEQASAVLTRVVATTDQDDDCVLLGDVTMKLGQWKTAAQVYENGFNRDKNNPVPLYFQGYCLVQAGQQRDGARLMALARALPLADESRRRPLALALNAAGLRQEAAGEYQLMLRTGGFNSWDLNNAMRHAWLQAHARRDYAASLALLNRSTLDCLHTSLTFNEQSMYLMMPSLIHRERGLGLIRSGEVEAGRKELDSAFELFPQDDQLVIAATMELEAAGHKADADALFARIIASQRKLMDRYPNSASLRNAVAWLECRCRRNVDDALAQAKRAAELAPRNTAILDTLAEACFQADDKAGAIAAIQRCIHLEPRNNRHKLCLERFEHSTKETEPPAGE